MKPESTKGRGAALTAAILGWLFDGLEMGLFPLVAGPALQELAGPDRAAQDAWKGAIYAGFLLGAACGGLYFGWLADRIGRVRALTWSILAYALCSGLSAFATEPWHLFGLRSLASVGMGGEWAVGVALVREVFPRGREALLAACIGAAANVGILLTALLGLWLGHVSGAMRDVLSHVLTPQQVSFFMGADNSGWRLLFLVGALPALMTFFIRRHVPESQRWKEAAATEPRPRVTEIFSPQLRRSTWLATAFGTIALVGMWCSVQWVPSWVNSFASGDAAARHTARATAYLYCAVGFVVGSFGAPFLAQRCGRRLSFLIISLGSLLSCAWLFRGPAQFDALFCLRCALAGTFSAAFFGWLPLALPELFPTRLRATGQGFAFNAGRIVAAGGTLLSGSLVASFGGDYGRMGAWMSLVYAVGLVLAFQCREAQDLPD